MNRIFQFFKKYRLGVLSGLIVGTSYIPFYPWGLFFSYIPLWYFVFFRARTGREAFIAGWVTQFTLTLIGFHWIAFTAKEFGGFPWPLAVIVLFLFCGLAHLYIALSMLFIYKLRAYFAWNFKQSLFSLVALVFLLETLWPAIFPWHLGYTLLWSKLPVFQLADLIGFQGLSLAIYLGQGFLFYQVFKDFDLTKPKFQKSSVAKPLGILIAGFLVLNIAGYLHAQKWRQNSSQIKVLQVQANIGNLERMQAEKGKGFRDEIVKKFVNLSETALQDSSDIDLIVWPEVAIPEYLNSTYAGNKNNIQIHDFLKRSQKSLLTGGFSKDKSIDDPERSVFNGLFLLDSAGKELSTPYHKTHLLAFGEYLPFSEKFPFLSKLLPFVSNFGRGPGPSIMVYPADQARSDFLMIGAQICYEGLFPEFSVGLAKKGAEILVNVTNDSWFGIPFEPYQHLYMTLARAIETRRPLLRSTNTGITTFINSYGEIGEQSPWNKEWAKRQVIPYQNNPENTFFTQVGHYLWIVILVAFFIHLLINGFYEKLRKS